jgi:hypothetical protein
MSLPCVPGSPSAVASLPVTDRLYEEGNFPQAAHGEFARVLLAPRRLVHWQVRHRLISLPRLALS